MGFMDLFKPLLGPILEPILRMIPDPNARKEAQEKIEASLVDAGNAAMAAQAAINQAEASNPNVFVSGWRPSVGWVCSAGLAWEFVLKPLATWAFVLAGHPLIDAPNLDTNELMGLITAMLGLAGYRTFEGVKGVKRK